MWILVLLIVMALAFAALSLFIDGFAGTRRPFRTLTATPMPMLWMSDAERYRRPQRGADGSVMDSATRRYWSTATTLVNAAERYLPRGYSVH